MKKLLSILVLSLLLSINAYAEIYTLNQCTKTKDRIEGYTVNPDYFDLTVDTKKKTITYDGDRFHKLKIISGDIENGFVSEKFNFQKDSKAKDRTQITVFPKRSSARDTWWYIPLFKKNLKIARDWKVVCKRSSYQEIAEKPKENPKKKKPKVTPSDDKIVAAGSGSGFFVSSNGTVITNHHVIEGCKLNKVSHKGSQYEAKVLAVDKVNDIAILKTNINPDRVFSVSNEDVSLLEDVVVAGYPLGKQVSSAIKTHKGVVTALAGAGDNYSNFQTDASINQGNSGGPILDQKGNVVGIAVATWVEEGVQGVHFGIKSSTLKTFASANGLKFLPANNRDLSNKDLGKLIMQSTVYVECHMTIASIKKMIAEAENKKAFFKEFE